MMHLTEVRNGYEGKSIFTYDIWYDTETSTGNKDWDDFIPYATCSAHTNWVKVFDDTSFSCALTGSNRYALAISGHAGGQAEAARKIPEWVLWLGGEYSVEARVRSPGSPVSVKVGGVAYNDKGWRSENYSSPVSVGTSFVNVRYDFRVLPEAKNMEARVYCSATCYIESIIIRALPTRARVTQRKLVDSSVSPATTYTFKYQYDEGATNDSEHSAAANTSHPYVSKYSQFRGHGMVREQDPYGRVTTTWFKQDDAGMGRETFSQISKDTLYDPLDSISSTTWGTITASGSIKIERINGDLAVKSENPLGDYGVQLYRKTESISPSGATNSITVQFRPSGSNVAAVLALEDGGTYPNPDYRRFGIWLKKEGSEHVIHYQSYNGSSWSDAKILGGIDLDQWYVLQMAIDTQKMIVRVWQRNNPEKNGYFELDPSKNGMSGRTWLFRQYVAQGTVWMDTYREGTIYTQTFSFDTIKNSVALGKSFLPPTAPDINRTPYTGLEINWIDTDRRMHLTYEGDATWVATQQKYTYDAYGNKIQQVDSKWDGDGRHYDDYRVTVWGFYPRNEPNGAYLVGLPAYQNVFKCPASSTNSNCAPGGVPELLSSHIYLYDNSTTFTQPPTQGILTGERTLLRVVGDAHYYSDVRYGYDMTWGNLTSVTTYTGEGTLTAFGVGTAQTTTTTYDAIYNTYPTQIKNAAGHTVNITYNTDLGVPIKEEYPNGITDPNKPKYNVTEADYDALGRITALARPGDTLAAPTLAMSYYDTVLPFSVQISQKGGMTQRKFYNGLGHLIQSQVLSASLSNGSRDILVDFSYDAHGRLLSQSVPYDVAPGSGYRTPSAPAKTQFAYDILGRQIQVTNPDTTTTKYRYDDLIITITDANGKNTIIEQDNWGRTIKVHPPDGPTVSYVYDQADLLTDVNYGPAHTAIKYDLAGRKVQQTDPDMGTWYYTYDGAGNLTRQRDARGRRICFYYDRLNRLVGKHYRTNDSCPTTSPNLNVSYFYDEGDNGIGQRTRMVDSSGSTTWAYDDRGRLTKETKVVTNAGTFVTEWGYTAADQLAWMIYPGGKAGEGGEQVNFTYHPQQTLKSVQGTSQYVQSITYDAAGRVDQRKSGNDVIVDHDYYAWTSSGGRLNTIKAGLSASPISMQYLKYVYDPVGNIRQIRDYKLPAAGYSYQSLAFTYDALNRLTDADATQGSSGNYSEDYRYDPNTGNLISIGGTILTYGAQISGCPDGALSKPHAVVKAGTNTYCYDKNGNMVRRTIGGSTTTLSYDYENRLTGASGATTASFVYDGDGNLVRETGAYINLAAGIVATGSAKLNNPDVITNGDIYSTSGYGTGREYAYNSTGSGLQYVQLDLGAVYSVDRIVVWHFRSGRTYHNTRTQVSADGATWVDVFDSAVSGEYVETLEGHEITFPARSVRYVRDWVNGSTANAGNHWTEIQVWGWADVTHIGNYFEWVGNGTSGGTQTMLSYYYAGDQRVAMRRGKWTDPDTHGLIYLLGDHLGSASQAVDPIIDSFDSLPNVLTELRYTPWGKTRQTVGEMATDYRFTGQRWESGLGLYHYGARWYDPYITQFTQPDSIIPDPYNPLDWNRYAYARSNPLKYTDPTGHFPWLLIPILIFIATIPGDTGPYEVDPATAAVGEAALRFVDPVDWVYTGVDCLSGNCSGTDLVFGVLPFVNGGMDDAADAARALGSTDALAHADDVVETAGQFHHIFSNKISNALNEHRTLSGVFNRDNFIVQGLDAASHNGYQAWHRAYDDEVVRWLSDHNQASREEFLSFMLDLYKRTDMQKRFSDAYKLLEMTMEEIE